MSSDKSYRAIDVANYVIKIAKENSIDDITNLKLQKILYFLQTAFLIKNNKSLINENFERWDYGPVVPEAYHLFKQFGSSIIKNPVSEFETQINWSAPNPSDKFKIIEHEFKEENIDEADRKDIKSYFTNINKMTAGELVDLTHSQTQWLKYKENGTISLHNAPKYTDDNIKDGASEDLEKYSIWETRSHE